MKLHKNIQLFSEVSCFIFKRIKISLFKKAKLHYSFR